MSDVRATLAEITDRAAAATPGPWTAFSGTGYDGGYHRGVRSDAPDGPEVIGDCYADITDVAFIAACRDDVPRLVAALTAALYAADRMETWGGSMEMSAQRVRDTIATALGTAP